MIHRQQFWNEPWSVGIHGTPWQRVIDADEFELHLNVANKKYGSLPKGLAIRKPGNYDRGDFKLTILLAVETGDPAIPAGQIGSVSNPRWGGVIIRLQKHPPKPTAHLSCMCWIHTMRSQILLCAGLSYTTISRHIRLRRYTR